MDLGKKIEAQMKKKMAELVANRKAQIESLGCVEHGKRLEVKTTESGLEIKGYCCERMRSKVQRILKGNA